MQCWYACDCPYCSAEAAHPSAVPGGVPVAHEAVIGARLAHDIIRPPPAIRKNAKKQQREVFSPPLSRGDNENGY